VSSYRPVTFPPSLRVSEILALLCSSTPLFPTPPLVSPKFLHVPLGLGGWPLGEEQRCWANCPCNEFPRFPTDVVLIDPQTLQTYGQTDRQTDDIQSQYSTLHYSALRGNNHLCRLAHHGQQATKAPLYADTSSPTGTKMAAVVRLDSGHRS